MQCVFRFDQPVDDVDARRLEAVRPDDVVALVEARLELDEHRDLLSLLGGLDEQVDQRRVLADAVQRHLDRDDRRVLDRRTQERLDRGERVEGMVHEVVLVAHLLEDGVDVVRRPERAGEERRVLQARTMQLRQLHPVAEAHAVVASHDHVLVDLEVLDEDVEDALGHAFIDLEQ